MSSFSRLLCKVTGPSFSIPSDTFHLIRNCQYSSCLFLVSRRLVWCCWPFCSDFDLSAFFHLFGLGAPCVHAPLRALWNPNCWLFVSPKSPFRCFGGVWWVLFRLDSLPTDFVVRLALLARPLALFLVLVSSNHPLLIFVFDVSLAKTKWFWRICFESAASPHAKC